MPIMAFSQYYYHKLANRGLHVKVHAGGDEKHNLMYACMCAKKCWQVQLLLTLWRPKFWASKSFAPVVQYKVWGLVKQLNFCPIRYLIKFSAW